MTVTSTRLGRLGPPQHHKTPRSPMCHECTTDLYLKFRVFLPSTRKRSRVPGLRRIMGRGLRCAVRSGGRVEYFCQKCGTQQRDCDVRASSSAGQGHRMAPRPSAGRPPLLRLPKSHLDMADRA